MTITTEAKFSTGRKIFCFGILFWLLSFAGLTAFEAPQLTGRVIDQTNTLTQAEKIKIDEVIRIFEKHTSGQIFVALLKPLEDVSIEEAGIKLMDKWKPGFKGKDNGAILIVVPKMRKMRLEIGYGWEGEVNDAKAGDIIRLMARYFKQNKFCDGVLAAIGRLARDVTGKPLPADLPEEIDENEPPSWFLLLIIVGFVFILIRCPWLGLFLLSGRRGGRGGFGGGGHFGGFSGGGGGRGGGGGASGSW